MSLITGLAYKTRFTDRATNASTETYTYWHSCFDENNPVTTWNSPSNNSYPILLFKPLQICTTTRYPGQPAISSVTAYEYREANGEIRRELKKIDMKVDDGQYKDFIREIQYADEVYGTMGSGQSHILNQIYSETLYSANVNLIDPECPTFSDQIPVAEHRTIYENNVPVEMQARKGEEWIRQQRISARDAFGNIQESIDANNSPTSTKWGYNSSMPIASIRNARNTETSMADFEDGTLDEWIGTENGSLSTVSHTGKNSWYISGSSYGFIMKSFGINNLDPAKKYIVSGWVKTSSPFANLLYEVISDNISPGRYSLPVKTARAGEWEYIEASLDLSTYTNITKVNVFARNGENVPQKFSECWWDDLRFYPTDALMTTANYDPATLIPTSKSDGNNYPTYFEYDVFQRPVRIRDHVGRTIEEKSYTYSRELDTDDDFNAMKPNVVSTAQFVNGNILPANWSFEQTEGGHPFGWHLAAQTIINTDAHSGAKSVKITNPNNTWSALYQELGVLKAGKTYTASVWFKCAGNVRGKIWFGNYIDYNENVKSLEMQGNDSWQRLIVTHTMSHDDPMGIFIYALDNGEVLYDDVMIEESKEPSTPVIMTQYADGLGREIQTQESGSRGNVIISHQTYDKLGRLGKIFKLFEVKTNSAFVQDAAINDAAAEYYNTNVYKGAVQDNKPFKLNEYYADGRIKSIKPEGSTWQTDHFIRYAYGTNTASDNTGYPEGTLYKTTVIDENNHHVVEFKDKLGNLVQTVTENGGNAKLTTTFTNNILGKVKQVVNPNLQTSTYSYNTLSQLIQKTTPDAGRVEYLYDKNGNLRLIRDANHPSGSRRECALNMTQIASPVNDVRTLPPLYMRTKIMLSVEGGDFTTQNYITLDLKKDGAVVAHVQTGEKCARSEQSIVLSPGTYQCEVHTMGEPGLRYSYRVTYGNSYDAVYRKYDAFNRLIEEGETVWAPSGDAFTQTHANEETFPADSRSCLSKKLIYDQVSNDPLAIGQRNLKGKLSESVVYRRGECQLQSFYSYDEDGRVEWIVHRGLGFFPKKLTYEYDRLGNVVKKGYEDCNQYGLGENCYTFYSYDQAGRLATVSTDTDPNGATKILEAEYTYFASRKVKSLKLGKNGVQTIDYVYNERDWLTQINEIDQPGTDAFAEKIQYHSSSPDVAIVPQFNGNIASTETYNAAASRNKRMAYGFSYDGANRLTGAENYFYVSPALGYLETKQWSMPEMKYDDAGNIEHLKRYNAKGTLVDDFDYHYLPGTNQLTSITNHADGQEMTYGYDENGNVIRDASRDIAWIEYDLHNQPIADLKSSDGASTIYSYDVNGERIRKYSPLRNDTYYIPGADGKTEVVLNHAYNRDFTINLWGNDNFGQIRVGPGNDEKRFYYLKDHLGSIRATVDESGNITSGDDYYPYGMMMDSRTTASGNVDTKLKFTGKERDVETGYDYFGARYYDSRTARWQQIDPLSENRPSLTPYNYALNSPMSVYDPDGNDAFVAITGNTVFINVRIAIYGSGATVSNALLMQQNLLNDWNNQGAGWKYIDGPSKENYNVLISTQVSIYNDNNPTKDPGIILDAWNPVSISNYIGIDENARSITHHGDAGHWRVEAASHEFGHLLGLNDRYNTKTGIPLVGWESNIMAELAGKGKVQQKNIDEIVKAIIEGDRNAGKPQNYQTKIDPSAIYVENEAERMNKQSLINQYQSSWNTNWNTNWSPANRNIPYP